MPMSLLFYRRPSTVAWTLAGTGAQFESDVMLSDGNPGVVTSFRWLSEVSPTIGNYVALRGDWTTPQGVRGAWLLGLALEGAAFPAGVKFEVRGKRLGDVGYPYALGGNALTEVCIAPGWSRGRNDQTEEARTRGSQLHEVERVNYDDVEVTLAPATGSAAFRQGLENDTDWQRINAHLTRAFARAMVYVRTEDAAGAFSSTDLHATSLFGRARPQRVAHAANSRDYYTAGWRIEEVPPIV